MLFLRSAPFGVLSVNTTSANADLRPRLLAGAVSCFFLIFSVFARRYESSLLTARWGCGDGYVELEIPGLDLNISTAF